MDALEKRIISICTFCSLSSNKIDIMIAAPSHLAAICADCILQSAELIAEIRQYKGVNANEESNEELSQSDPDTAA